MVGLKCFILLSVAACIYGEEFYFTGSCPDGKGVGERWVPDGKCMECYCDQTGHGCTGCKTLTPIDGCYEVVNTTLVYPECCPRLHCVTFNGLGD